MGANGPAALGVNEEGGACGMGAKSAPGMGANAAPEARVGSGVERGGRSMTRRRFAKLAGIAAGSVAAGIALPGCAPGTGAGVPEDGSPDLQPDGSSTNAAGEGTAEQSAPVEEPAAGTAPDGYDSTFPWHEAVGTGAGAMPGRVAWAYDPEAVRWDGSTRWWEPGNYDEARVRALVDRAVACTGGAESAAEGWRVLFAHHNGGAGYAPGQTVAVKCNMNGAAEYDDDTTGTATGDLYANPVLLKCLLESLVEDAGVAPSDIVAYDVTRIFPDYLRELCSQGVLSGVRFVDRNPANADAATADETAPVLWSGPVRGAACFYPTCVTQADYLVNLADLKGHDYGITLCAKNHFGSFCNSSKMRQPQEAGLHPFLSGQRMGDYSPLVDLMGSAQLGGKTVLYVLSALVAPSRNTSTVTPEISRWSMEPFDGGCTASVFMSQDPVAIDSVGADFLMNEPAMTGTNASLSGNAGCENYLHEAAQAGSAPSGTAYADGAGAALSSLGVHEHWDNARDKRYGRNLGKAEGIELVRA